MKRILLIIGIIALLSGCGKKIENNLDQKSQEVENLENQVENQQNQITELKEQLEENVENKEAVSSSKEETQGLQVQINNEAECRKLYSANPECTISNKIYRNKESFNKFLKNEIEEHDASDSDVSGYKKTFTRCQEIIAKCG